MRFLHTHTHAHTHTHTHTLTLTDIRLIRIERVIVLIRYNVCRDGSCKWNLEVKRARPRAL
jgi:hypothetical protein